MTARRREVITGTQKLAYVLWFQLLCDPQYIFVALGFVPASKAPLVLVVLLALATLASSTKAGWLPAMGLWILATAINLPSSDDLGASLVPFKQLIVYYVIGLGVVRAIRTPKTAAPILFLLCVGQYLWWGAFGVLTGDVSWHPDFANYDGYGPLMATGVGPAYFYFTAAGTPKGRKLALLAVTLCLLGVVSSFARGAIVSLVVTLGYIWLRSPNKGRTGGFIIVAVTVGSIAASFIKGETRGDDTQSSFWDEMATIFDKGGTRGDRAALVDAAVQVFKRYPVFGAGAGNFGMAAASIIQVGGVGGNYGENPGRLAQRALHNIYYQLLSEYGIIGFGIFIYMLVTFWRNSQLLRREESKRLWYAAGGTEDVSRLTLGLESGLVAFLINGYFYNMLFYAVLYAFLFTNILLRTIVDQSRLAGGAGLQQTSHGGGRLRSPLPSRG